MNQVTLIGNLVSDPVMRYTSEGVAYTYLRIAVNRRYTNQDGHRDADFLDILVWRKQAENCAYYLRKGRKVGVTGEVRVQPRQDEDGGHHQRVFVQADNVEFLDPPQERHGRSGTQASAPSEADPQADTVADASDPYADAFRGAS